VAAAEPDAVDGADAAARFDHVPAAALADAAPVAAPTIVAATGAFVFALDLALVLLVLLLLGRGIAGQLN
jgi:hypothetical protein